MTVSPLSQRPRWARLLAVGLVAAVCLGGVLAAVLVLVLTPHQEAEATPRPSSAGADDAGGGAALDSPDPLSPPPPSGSRLGSFAHAAVAVDSEPCSRVGRDILAREGTAVDAAIAVLFCNGVVTPQSMGIGGGFVMTIQLANGTAASLVAREMAPAAASRDMFQNHSSTLGPRAAGVPGEVAGYWAAKQRFGNPALAWAELVQPAIQLCNNGIKVSPHAASALRRSEEKIMADPGLKSVFVNPETGRVWRLGDSYTNPVLGATLATIARGGAEALYADQLGERLVADLRAAGGLITMQDLERYEVSWGRPVTARLPGTSFTLATSPPPASGSVMLAILGTAAQYGPAPPDLHRPAAWHRFIEACKFGFAKRTLLGDWEAEAVAGGVRELVANLTSEQWWAATRASISDTETHLEPEWYGAEFSAAEDGGTAHMSVLSPAGDAVSVTSTVNLLYGSKFMSPSTGIILNNQMDDFSYPGITNAFGVPPSEANMVAAGKRPVSSMSPSIVTDGDSRVVAVVGASGGTKIITAVAQVLYRLLYLGQDAKEAVDARRLHHQLVPMRVQYEAGVTRWMVQGLEARGHTLTKLAQGGSIVQAIAVDRDTGEIHANADFRKHGTVDGF